MHLGRMHYGVVATVVLAIFFFLSGASTEAQTVFPGAGTGSIADAGIGGCGSDSPPGAPRVVSFSVSGITQDVGKVALEVNLNHTWVGDLTARLAAPGGQPASQVFGRIGGTTSTACGDSSNFSGAYGWFDGNQYADIWAAAASVGGADTLPNIVYNPSSFGGVSNGGQELRFVNAFYGMTPIEVNGTWTLTFVDNSPGDTGAVNAASLLIFGGPIFADGFESGGTLAWSSTFP